MISFNSIKNFIYINGLLFFLGYSQYQFFSYSTSFLIVLPTFLARNYFLMNFIDYNLKEKENIYNNAIVEDYKNEFIYKFFSTTFIETLTYLLIKHIFYQRHAIQNIYLEILYFLPLSFVVEIIFDFFHYWTHRISHSNKYLYLYSHKSHHKFRYTKSILTFYHNPLDLILTNTIPQLLTLSIFPYFSLFQFNVFLFYKTFIEISGHCGKKLFPSGCFTQFIWLPKFLDITLYTEDHNLHHYKNNCNYAKRFSLWDKLFGTYENNHINK